VEYISTGVRDYDKQFGGIPKGKLSVFIVDPDIKLATIFSLITLSWSCFNECYLVDANGMLLSRIYPSITTKKINPNCFLDINGFNRNWFDAGVAVYKDALIERKKLHDEDIEPIIFINDLQGFFSYRYDNLKETIKKYVDNGITTVGILYDHKNEYFNLQFAEELNSNADSILKVILVRADCEDRAIFFRRVEDINRQIQFREEYEIFL